MSALHTGGLVSIRDDIRKRQVQEECGQSLYNAKQKGRKGLIAQNGKKDG